jgi:hypothetical protein
MIALGGRTMLEPTREGWSGKDRAEPAGPRDPAGGETGGPAHAAGSRGADLGGAGSGGAYRGDAGSGGVYRGAGSGVYRGAGSRGATDGAGVTTAVAASRTDECDAICVACRGGGAGEHHSRCPSPG